MLFYIFSVCVCVWDELVGSTFGYLLYNIFISFVQATAKGFVLIQTKEVSMRPEDVKRVFQDSADDLVNCITKGTLH